MQPGQVQPNGAPHRRGGRLAARHLQQHQQRHLHLQHAQHVRGAIICKTVDASAYAVGDEVDFAGIAGVENGGSFERGKVFSLGGNATNVFCIQSSTMFLYVNNKTSGVPTQLTHASWKAKIYARP